MKIYLADDEADQQQTIPENADLQFQLDFKEAENEILRVENEQLVNSELRSQAEINQMKFQLKRSKYETEKLKK